MFQMKCSYIRIFLLFISFAFYNCQSEKTVPLEDYLEDSPSIVGKQDYLGSPFVTAGDRVYMVGHQDGSFPDLGWHIKGEMGGIWNHPIKLMDGFEIQISDGSDSLGLDKAVSFTNYPFANMHKFEWPDKNIEIERWQFVPDSQQGMVVQLVIKNNGPERKVKVKFTGISDLRPTWLGERTNMVDGKDKAEYDENIEAWKVKDELNDWYTIFGSELSFENNSNSASNETTDNTTSSSVEDVVFLFANEKHVVNYFIAGSYTSESDAIMTFNDIKDNFEGYFKSKRNRYAQLAQMSKLTIPDKKMEQAFEWLKYNCDWLIRDVPEVGRGITAGIPDYPWWFGVDSEYALKGYMAIGQKDIVHETIALLDSVSNAVNGNGMIIHEMSSNGTVFNHGNINETPQFASLIWEVYRWNGDRSFLEKYYPTVKNGLEWLMKEKDENGNLFPDGFGMMEIHGLDSEMIDVAAYTQRAFVDASKMAKALGDTEMAASYEKTATELAEKINTEFWSEEFNSYADFIGTDEQALHLIDDAIVRADTLNKPWAIEELKATRQTILNNPSKDPRPYVLHHNWVVNTPMEMGIADTDKALRALETAERFVNPFGVFVTGIDRDESAGSDDGSFKGSKVFSYTGAVMTLPTGVQVVAENNYGRPDKALNYLERMTRTFNYALPGSIYEVSPDYGMMTQAWNIYSYAVPIVQQFFGIQPDAANKKVLIKPQMPDKWNQASLENVAIADNTISMNYEKSDGLKTISIVNQNSWDIVVELPNSNGTEYLIPSAEVTLEIMDDIVQIKSSSKEIKIVERKK